MSVGYDGTGEDIEAPGLLASLPVILWQRRWLLIIPAVLLTVVAAAAAFLLPRTYQARATLLVESKDSPDATPGQVDPIDRRMARIRQQILSRPDLVELIQANDLYNASRRAQPLSVLVDRMRKATDISAVNADIQSAPAGGSTGSVAFQLTFDYPQPGPAQLVAQTFVDRLLKLDATQTQQSAQSNVNYLQDQESGLQAQVTQIENRMREVAGANGTALSSAGAIMMSGGAGIDYAGQISTLQRENAQLAGQASTAVDRDPNVVSAEAALTAAQATYSDSHPDVQLARKRLEIARASAGGISNRNVSTAVRQQIAANNAAIGDLNRQRAAEQSRISTMAAAQARGPAAAQQEQQLQAQADMIRANLAKVSSSLLNARSVSKLTDEQRAERLTLIEPPVTPDHPTSPNRPVLIVGGIVGGLALGLALVLLIELLQRPIRSAAQLTQLLGEPPLAVVPVLNPRQGRFARLFRRQPVRSRRPAMAS
ncbi:Wzz/FepE/Etk N-terminal domain-containing protein [Sphingomonas bacterium]|uniref:Wzz/FepE/Etk N-terminal domain-containing protein n=1 Tax=Sphingomonas bacterium TaxID=1895847 RepID=UPI0020C5F156|nr:Wzz/FepE/Etk N-terminal domain-containing protein [Sphingomonas bacterium]